MTEKKSIEAKDLGRFSVDGSNKLYWDDKPIKSENIHLSIGQKIFAFAIAASAILASLTTVNQEYCIIDLGKSCTASNSQEVETIEQVKP